VIQLVENRVRRSELGCGKGAQLCLAEGGSTVRFRLIALVLLVIAATAAGFVLTQVDSSRDSWLVFGTGSLRCPVGLDATM
jgi:hypothetical protein